MGLGLTLVKKRPISTYLAEFSKLYLHYMPVMASVFFTRPGKTLCLKNVSSPEDIFSIHLFYSKFCVTLKLAFAGRGHQFPSFPQYTQM